MIGNQTIEALGDELYTAFSQRQPIQPLSDRMPDLAIANSYLIQQRMLKDRLDSIALRMQDMGCVSVSFV